MKYMDFASKISFYEFLQSEFKPPHFKVEAYKEEIELLSKRVNIEYLTKVLKDNPGDKLAKKITDETAKALAILCINVLHTTEPQRIVFAGGMIAAGDVLLNRIKDYFNEHIWNLKKETVEICFATLGEDAGIIGAAALAIQTKNEVIPSKVEGSIKTTRTQLASD